MHRSLCWDPPAASATLTTSVMSNSGGSATLLPEPFEVRKDAVDKAAPAARAAAARISQTYRRRAAARTEPDPSDERPR